MRLSEDRINAIAYKIAFELKKKRFIKSERSLMQLEALVEKPILDHMHGEDALDEEVRAHMARRTTCPPEGSFEYQALFLKTKEEFSRRRGYAV